MTRLGRRAMRARGTERFQSNVESFEITRFTERRLFHHYNFMENELIMYNDPKYKMNWRDIAVHDDKNVRGFFDRYQFLSNFAEGLCEFEGTYYRTTELAYQAAKVAPKERYQFLPVTSAESKKLWKKIGTIYKPEEWDLIKESVMRRVVFSKFELSKDRRQLLLETGNRYLEETLWWRDTFWGWDVNLQEGKNKLGKILMATRAYWQNYA